MHQCDELVIRSWKYNYRGEKRTICHMTVVMGIKDDSSEEEREGREIKSWNENRLSPRSNAGILLKNTTILSEEITITLSQLREGVNEM